MMRQAKNNIIVTALVCTISFFAYISSWPAILIDSMQMNEVLVALFGAGISIFFSSICSYRYERKKLENALLERAERALSGLHGLRECVIESAGGSRASSVELLLGYFEEEENRFCNIIDSQENNVARNKLIRVVERCDESQVETYLNDPNSSFNRFVERSRKSIDSAADSYLYLSDSNFDSCNQLLNIVAEIDYLPLTLHFLKRKRLLEGIRKLVESYMETLTPIVLQSRLFKCKEIGYGQILPDILEAEKKWLSRSSSDSALAQSENDYADDLYRVVQEFASLTSSPLKKQYPASSWRE